MIFASLLVPLSWLLVSRCNAGNPCPNKTEILPCTCTNNPAPTDTDATFTTTAVPRRRRAIDHPAGSPADTVSNSSLTVILCESPLTPSQLGGKISAAVNRMWIDKLVIHSILPERGNTLARLPTDFLRDCRVRQLEIQNTLLFGDFIRDGNPLINQGESLYWLKVSNCYLFGVLTYDTIGTIQTRGLNILQKLQGLDFSSNHLSAISVSAFRVPPKNLTTLILANNNLQLIDVSSFNQIPLLKHIDLSHNLLISVLRTYFASPAKSLEHIDLSYNSIQALPEDFFVNMPALKWVDISNNFIYSLAVRPWSVVWKQLNYINVSDNFLECDCQFLWLLPILNTLNKPTGTKDIPGQIVKGQCAQTVSRKDNLTQPIYTVNHDIISLKRDNLTC